MKLDNANQAHLTSSSPWAMAPTEEVTIDLTTVSVRESISSMEIIAGSIRITAYKNPNPNKTIIRIAKQTTTANHNGTVIVTSDRKLNLDEIEFGTD